MEKAIFYYKAKTINELRVKSSEEVRELLRPIIKDEEKLHGKDFDKLLKLLTRDNPEKEYSVQMIVPLRPKEYDYFANHLLVSHEFMYQHIKLMGEDDKGVVKCLLVYCDKREYALLVNGEGHDYARYTAKVPLKEIET